MPLITWSNDLSVNIRSIDEQHKKLVSPVNSLHDAMSSGKGKDVMGKNLGELIPAGDLSVLNRKLPCPLKSLFWDELLHL